jgi:hypothetical protein
MPKKMFLYYCVIISCAEARVLSQDHPCAICARASGTGVSRPRSASPVSCQYHSVMAAHIFICLFSTHTHTLYVYEYVTNCNVLQWYNLKIIVIPNWRIFSVKPYALSPISWDASICDPLRLLYSYIQCLLINIRNFFPHGVTTPSGAGPLQCWGFTITLRHTTFGRVPLDEWSARRRDHYLHKSQHFKETDIRAPGGIRKHNASKQAAAFPRLRPRDLRNRHIRTIAWNKKAGTKLNI